MSWEISSIYLAIIGLEVFFSNYQHKKLYTWRETVINFFLSFLNGALDLAIRGLYLVLLTFVFQFHLFDIGQPVIYWVLLFILVDFQFYWLHRLEHFCRIFWAAHVTHHSAEHMNLTVGVRASLMRPLYDFVFFIPIAFIGFKPIDIFLIYSISQIWAMFLHTEMVGKLGWVEYVFVTPSHHRVHHASNARYIDKNMGMVLIVWDRLFGTFQRELSPEEYEPIRYGLAKPMKDSNLFTVIFHEWINIAKDVRKKDLSWTEKFLYVFGPPGWTHEKRR
ncbi:MAG: sterol desaturase family protein [Chitinophagaceae bacterium]|nr:sterol desaturase family protein [Chitinophagaceae bacterium]